LIRLALTVSPELVSTLTFSHKCNEFFYLNFLKFPIKFKAGLKLTVSGCKEANCVGGDVGSYSQHFLNPLNQILKEQVSRDFLKKVKLETAM
jgi:hypothetical protein